MTGPKNAQTDFDVAALFDALDAQRRDRMLSWQGVARELWDLSATLVTITQSAHRPSPAWRNEATPPVSMRFFMLRWLNRTPESFVPGSTLDASRIALPRSRSTASLGPSKTL